MLQTEHFVANIGADTDEIGPPFVRQNMISVQNVRKPRNPAGRREAAPRGGGRVGR